MFTVEIAKQLHARQGLRSPVRAAKGLPGLVPQSGFSVIVRAGINFDDTQLNERGWFVDTDAVEAFIIEQCDYLAGNTWTELFEFRPTFEAVAKWLYEDLKAKVPQLNYIELENETINVKTRYIGGQ